MFISFSHLSLSDNKKNYRYKIYHRVEIEYYYRIDILSTEVRFV
jgi:hypothetical protein